MARRDLTRNDDESEKAIESYLCRLTHEAGGIALKYASAATTGYPDRLLLFPYGRQAWVEVKSKGRLPTPLQCHRINRLRALGHAVFICDSRAGVEEIIRKFKIKGNG